MTEKQKVKIRWGFNAIIGSLAGIFAVACLDLARKLGYLSHASTTIHLIIAIVFGVIAMSAVQHLIKIIKRNQKQ